MSKLEPRQASPKLLFRLLDWADNSRVSIFGFAVIFFIASGLILYLVAWVTEGVQPEVNFEYFFPGLYMPILLVFWHLMNSSAYNAISTFAQGVKKTAKQAEDIYIDFVSVKGWVVWLLVVLAIPISISYVSGFTGSSQLSNPIEIPFLYLIVFPTTVLQTLLMFRVFRQLFRLNFHYKDVKDINLFNLGPVYSLTSFGYNLAIIGIVAITAIDIVSFLQGTGFDLPNNIVSFVMLIAIFVAPTVGISRRIRAEKAKDLRELGNQLNSLYDETTAAVKGRKLNKVPSLSSAAQAVERQIEKVQKVATWPWNPGSLRNLLLPILLPLAVAILQRYVLVALGF